MPSATVGGAERVAFNLIEYLLRQDWDILLVTMSIGSLNTWGQLEKYRGFKWTALTAPSEKRSVLASVKALRKLNQTFHPKFIYTTHTHVNAMVSLLRMTQILRVPIHIARESTNIFLRMRGLKLNVIRILYKIYGKISLLIYQTEEMRENLVRNMPRVKNFRSRVLPNPVNLAYIDEMVGSHLTTAKPRNIVVCGRLIGLKRVDMLLQALALLPEDAWDSASIIGDGPMLSELRILAAELRLDKKVTFFGRIENPYAHFAAARVGVLCSTREGFPNVLLEMMASGTDRVVSSLCTSAVTKLPGVEIVRLMTPETLASALATALEAPSLAEQYREHIVAQRSVEAFWQSITDACPRLAAAGTSAVLEKAG